MRITWGQAGQLNKGFVSWYNLKISLLILDLIPIYCWNAEIKEK